jgi:hypothetical protein
MVQSHRCPATVSGPKSALATEVYDLGKAQRVDECRESGDLLGFQLGSLSRGRAPVESSWCVTPTSRGWGFFLFAVAPFLWFVRSAECADAHR